MSRVTANLTTFKNTGHFADKINKSIIESAQKLKRSDMNQETRKQMNNNYFTGDESRGHFPTAAIVESPSVTKFRGFGTSEAKKPADDHELSLQKQNLQVLIEE